MNLFFLSLDPRKAARYQCDKHVVKMILECAQMLSTAFWELWKNEKISLRLARALYRPTHINHPMSLWVRATRQNFQWTLDHAMALCDQYTQRYKKIHKTQRNLEVMREHAAALAFKYIEFTMPPQCMPEEYRGPDAVEAYRRYYREEKKTFAKWAKLNNTPEWFQS